MIMGQSTEVLIPNIGDFDAVEIIEIAVQPGAEVKPEDTLLTLESDKATMDIPAPAAGTVTEVMVRVGDAVSEGTPILKLEQAGSGNEAPETETHGEEAPETTDKAAPPATTTPHSPC